MVVESGDNMLGDGERNSRSGRRGVQNMQRPCALGKDKVVHQCARFADRLRAHPSPGSHYVAFTKRRNEPLE
jgi:hypothetical protein